MAVPRRLPSLTALRAFEAAARHLSFTQAAAELFVTQAAVSRQVRDLEGWLGKPLFHRLHRRVELTREGEVLAGQLTESLDALARLVQEVREPETVSLRVSVEPALAAKWLVPRLGRFRSAHLEVELVLDSSMPFVRLGTDADVAIRWSATQMAWPGANARRLAEVEVFPVLSPVLRDRGPALRRPSDLLRHTLLYEDDRSYWGRWFERAGLARVRLPRGPVFNDLALAIDAAVRGEGVALGEPAIVADDVAAGRLIRPFRETTRLGAYWLVTPSAGSPNPAATAFDAWVDQEMVATYAAWS